jgi:hypothetical protein
MKLIVLTYSLTLLVLATSLSAFGAESCRDLMSSFFRHEEGKTISNKTAKMDITKFGLEENVINREKFERLYLQCLSPDKNQIKDLASKRYSKINLGMSVVTSVSGYTYTNWEKPKDMEWFGRLGYGLAFGAACGKIYGKLVKDDGSKFHHIIKDYIFGRVATVAYFGGFTVFFDANADLKAKVETLKKSPTFEADMKKLRAYIDDEKFNERYQKETIDYLSQLEEINLGIGIQEGVDFDHLKPSDLKDPDIQKVVMAAIVAQEYEQQKGILAVTGSKNNDYLLYDSIYSLAKIPKEIIVHKMIDQAVCLNSHNPARGITQAVGITALNQILFADYYGITYKVLKKELIGQ